MPYLGEGLMKKYEVCLTDEERKVCEDTIDRLKGSSQKARRARIHVRSPGLSVGFEGRFVGGPAFTDPSVQLDVVEQQRRRDPGDGTAAVSDRMWTPRALTTKPPKQNPTAPTLPVHSS